MDADRYDELAAIFMQLVDLPDEEQIHRARELTQDEELLEAIQNMLISHREGSFLTCGTGQMLEIDQGFAFDKLKAMPSEMQGYKLEAYLGNGASGTVYLAHAPLPLERTVAIKVLNEWTNQQALARFHEEQRILAQLHHPGIAEVYDQGLTSDGRPFTVLEYVEGAAITDYCGSKGLHARAILRLMIQCTQAVGHAHQRNIIHRDLKPSNLLVTDNNGRAQIKVIDFGTAKSTDPFANNPELTADSQFVGTLSYSSPEQLSGQYAPDTRADVHALGVVLYECLEGQHPYFDCKDSLRATIDRIAEQPIPRLRERAGVATRELDAILSRACAKDSADRYSSMQHFGEDMQNLLNGLPVQAMRPRPAYIVGKFVARNRILLGAVSIVLVVLALLGATAIDRGIQASRSRGALKDTAMGLVDDVMPQLADLNGSTEVRTELASSLLQRIEELLVTDPTDRELLWRRAHVLEYMSDLQLAADRIDQAGSLRDEAAKIIQSLKQEQSESRLLQDERRLMIKLGDVAKSRKDFDEARYQYEAAHALLLAAPGDHRSALSWSYERLAHIAHSQRRKSDHRMFGQKRLDMALELLDESPDSPAQLHNCAMAHQAMAEIEHSSENRAAALVHALHAQSTATRLVGIEPNLFSSKVIELSAHVIVMRALYYVDRLDEGDLQANKVRQLAVQLAALNPSREDATRIARQKLQQVIDLWSVVAPERDPAPIHEQMRQVAE